MAHLRKSIFDGHLAKGPLGHLVLQSTGATNPHDVTISVAGSCSLELCSPVENIDEMLHQPDQPGGSCWWQGVAIDQGIQYYLRVFQHADGTVEVDVRRDILSGYATMFENNDVSGDVTIDCNEITGTFDLVGLEWPLGGSCLNCTATVTVAPQ